MKLFISAFFSREAFLVPFWLLFISSFSLEKLFFDPFLAVFVLACV